MDEDWPLTIAPERVCRLIAKARQFEAKDAASMPDPGSNPADDGVRAMLEDHPDDPVRMEIGEFIRGLNEDEQIDLVALAWLGRGDDTPGNWESLRASAADAHNARTAAYLLGQPLLASYLEAALDQFEQGCDPFDMERT